MKTTINKNLGVSLSFGSTHTSLLVASLNDHNFNLNNALNNEAPSDVFQILGVSRVSNNGAIKKGVVSSIDTLTNSISETIDEVERQTGLTIESVKACISGLGLQFDNHAEMCTIKSDEIRMNDIERINVAVRNQKAPAGFDFIHMIPSFYSVDNKHGIKNPIGMKGSSLSVMHHRLFFPQTELHNYVKACNNAGVCVQGFVFESLAAAEGIITLDEKEYGCVSLSIGAFLSHVTVYLGGVPVYTKVYPIGSNHITKDLSIGLRTTQAEAERIKKEFGKALGLKTSSSLNEKIEIQNVEGFQHFATKRDIHKIIEPRVREILETISFDLKRNKLLAQTAKGVILSGGGSLLNGISLATEDVFGIHTRIGQPRNIAGSIEGMRSPIWASQVGALSSLFKSNIGDNLILKNEENIKTGSIATKFWKRIKEPFVIR